METSYDAAAMLVTFVLFGHWLEMRSRRGSSDALNTLLRLVPAQANLIGPEGEIKVVPVKQVQVGNLLLLRPGEKVAVDGLITEGESSLDESEVGLYANVEANIHTKAYLIGGGIASFASAAYLIRDGHLTVVAVKGKNDRLIAGKEFYKVGFV